MKKYRVIFWLYLVRTWLYLPGEIVELNPDEAIRYAAQIEETAEAGKYRIRDGFYLHLVRSWLYTPGETVELTTDEAVRHSDKIEEIVEELVA